MTEPHVTRKPGSTGLPWSDSASDPYADLIDTYAGAARLPSLPVETVETVREDPEPILTPETGAWEPGLYRDRTNGDLWRCRRRADGSASWEWINGYRWRFVPKSNLDLVRSSAPRRSGV